MRFLVELTVVSLLAGCVEHRVTTWRSTLAAASTDLRTKGEATIEVAEGDDQSYDSKRSKRTVRTTDNVRVELELGQGASRKIDLRVDKLLAGCPAEPFKPDQLVQDQHPECMLTRTVGPLVLERSRRSNKGLAVTIVGGLVYSGAIVCSFACEPPYSTASQITAGVITAVGLVSLGIVLLAMQAH